MAASESQSNQNAATHSGLLARLRSVNLELQRRDQERDSVLQTIRGLMTEHSLSVRDILDHACPVEASPARNGRTLPQRPAMYMDPVSGKFWSGRGPCPKWLRGRLDQFRVEGF